MKQHHRQFNIFTWMRMPALPHHKKHRIGGSYTYEDMKKLKIDYENNFKKLYKVAHAKWLLIINKIKVPDDLIKEHDKYLKKEAKLYRLNKDIQKDLGLDIKMPICPDIDIVCERCIRKHCHIRDNKLEEDIHEGYSTREF